MSRILFSLACASLLATTACTREPADPAAEPAQSAAQTPAAPSPATGPAAPLVERKRAHTDRAAALAGTFSGTLPCADCPGIDTTLQLDAGGHFALTRAYQGEHAASEPLRIKGSWSMEAEGTQLRLDPGNKSDADVLFAVNSNDQLTMLSADGSAAASGLDYSLQRQAAD